MAYQQESILRNVPYENGFHFNTPAGNYTGTTAVSLEDFRDKLKNMDTQSVAYHYYRGDIQVWVNDVLGDNDFADRLCFIQRGMTEDQLRAELMGLLNRRLGDLKIRNK